jgi:hypothetical protein
MAVVVTGYSELSRLGFRLREAKAVELTKELRQGLRDSLRPLADQIRAGAPDHTPKGYEVTFARSLKFHTKINTVGTGAGVDFSVTATGKSYSRQIREINRGRLKHTVYGRRRLTRKGWINNPWVWQAVEPGFFDNPVRANFNEMRTQMRAAMHRVAEKITRG